MNMLNKQDHWGQQSEETVSFRSGEKTLKGKLLIPNGAIETIVVLNGATGVPARFYEAFARWLATEKQMACLIYDYRDFGWSAKKSLRKSKAKMSDWGVYDQEAARGYAASRFPDVPLWIIGHSLGGMCLPFQRNLDQIDRVIAVASGMVHVRDHPWPYRALALAFWYGPAPVATGLAGFLPAELMRIGKNLPAGVYWQWRRWCTRRDFYSGDIGNELPYPDWTGLTAPTKFVAMTEDVMAPPKTVWKLMQCFPSAPKTQLSLRAADYGLEKIGHIDVFAEKNAKAWDALIA